jgi:hypothetical protein
VRLGEGDAGAARGEIRGLSRARVLDRDEGSAADLHRGTHGDHALGLGVDVPLAGDERIERRGVRGACALADDLNARLGARLGEPAAVRAVQETEEEGKGEKGTKCSYGHRRKIGDRQGCKKLLC